MPASAVATASPPFSPLLTPLLPFAGRAVVVGVSGGADSVALLRALVLVGARPVVAHFDHALRPDSAADAAWVAELAAGLGCPLETVRVDVAAVARRRGWNLEDAARRLRYDFLARTAKKHSAKKHAVSAILTAHTRRDQAETVLMRLLRGEAVLTGILAQSGAIQRPWLAVARPDLEAFLHHLGQEWREDPTNADPTYTRAWIRQQVTPLLTARVPNLEEALARIACLSAEDDAALSAQAAALTAHAPLSRQPRAVLRRYAAGALAQAGLNYHGEHLETITDHLQQSSTTHLTLPGNHAVTVTGGRLVLESISFPAPEFAVPDGWERRFRQPGDRIVLPGGTRKLSDVLTDLHLPRAERDRVPLLVSGAGVRAGVQWVGLAPPYGEPLWAVGAREAAGVTPSPLQQAMTEALALAAEAAAAQEVPVGAVVITAAGEVVGRGRNRSREAGDMTRHAELDALRGAAATLGTPYLTDCTLVVTLEPCPMCLGAALEARIGRIVYGASNPKAGALGGVTDLLASHWGHRPEVVGGVQARAAGKLLREFFAGRRGGFEG